MDYQWVTISEDTLLYEGDRVRFYYQVIGPTYVTAAQIALLEKNLESEKRFTLLGYSIPQGWVSDVYFEVRINKLPQQTQQTVTTSLAPILIAAIAAGVVAQALAVHAGFMWLRSKQITKQTEIKAEAAKAGTPIEEGSITSAIKETGTTAIKIAAAAIIGVLIYRFVK